MPETRAVTLANIASSDAFTVDNANDRVGIGSTVPDATLDIKNTVIVDGVAGVVTAIAFDGDGSRLTGVANTDVVVSSASTTGRLVVNNDATVSGVTTAGGVVLKDTNIVAGVVTGSSFVGDGSGLTGVANTDVVHTREITASGVSTFSNDVNFGSDVTFEGASYNAVWDHSQNSLEFGDNAAATFGAGRDLLIYHDSNNSYVQDNATGDLILQSNSTVKIKPADDDGITANSNGSIQLYHDGVERLHTDVDGVEVIHAGTANTSRFHAGGSVGVGIGVTTTTGRDAVGAAGTVKGQIVFNETDGVVQVYNGNQWDQLSNIGEASGGDTSAGVAPGNGFQYHVFTSPGNLTITGGSMVVDMLLVAGGGGGGGGMGSHSHAGGAGGAGGIAEVTSMPLSAGTYAVTVPTSNAAGANGNTGLSAGNGTPGGDTTITGTPAGTITAKGGGGGGSNPSASTGLPGGSGGGGGSFNNDPGGTALQPTQNPGQPLVTNYGNAGGTAGDSDSDYGAGGGGGAGGAGQGTSEPGNSGNGGNGRPFTNYPYPLYGPIVPSPFQPTMGPVVGPTGMFGGGGGGGGGADKGEGGPGGGGSGATASTPGGTGASGVNGTGGGAGGGGDGEGGEGGAGGSGGRGVVIVRVHL